MKKYFKNHPKAKFWDFEKNIFDLDKITLYSGKFCWFKCDKCNHSFNIQIDKITRRQQWCSYCKSKKLCDCNICFKKSFASHPKSKYWNFEKNKLMPKNFFLKSDKKCWFICNNCHHNFEIIIKNITQHNKWCSYCCNPPKNICDCNICFQKSFASGKKSKFWDYNKNNKKPNEVFKNTSKKYWFICEKNHSFNSSLDMVSGRNTWCPFCKNKTETKLFEWLCKKYSNVNYQQKFDWCRSKNKRYLPFDFCLIDKKLLIELDGPQHFVQISNWEKPHIIQKRDKYKENMAKKNGYKVIRILQEDVFDNKNNWEETLKIKIDTL